MLLTRGLDVPFTVEGLDVMRGLQPVTAASPIRLSPANTVVCIRLKHKYALPVDSRFTLHSVSGFRLQNGALQIERIAGFCHLKNTLKTYWLDQVESLRSPAGEMIEDLASWLDQCQPAMMADEQAAPDGRAAAANLSAQHHAQGSALAGAARQTGSVSKSIDKAIEAAVTNGFGEIADRLREIKSLLPDLHSPRTGIS